MTGGPTPPGDLVPEFSETVSDQTYGVDQTITALELPSATGGDGALTYSLSPALPAGLTFNASTRTITGTPTSAMSSTPYTYTVTDSDAVDPDSDTLTFTITVTGGPPPPTDLVPEFSETVPNQTYGVNGSVSLQLPSATGGDGALTYSLSPGLPAGLTFSASTRTISGAPTVATPTTTYTYTVTDSDAVDPDSDTLTFTITVTGGGTTGSVPDFGTDTVPDLTYDTDEEIADLLLPSATGGDGTLTYSLSPALPAGLTFNASARTITGTQTAVSAATTYTYTVTDSNAVNPSSATLAFDITVVETLPTPGRPSGLTLTKLSNEAVAIDWDDAAYAAGYELSVTNGTNWTLLPAAPFTLTCSGLDTSATYPVCISSMATVGGLTHRSYYIFIRSRNTTGDSIDASVTVDFTAPDFGEATLEDQS